MPIICRIRGRHWWRMVGYERADGAVCVRDECGWCGKVALEWEEKREGTD